MPRNDDVQSNNNHIFKAFRLNFEQGKPEAFLDSANQLVHWLSDQRAYYDSARRSVSSPVSVSTFRIHRPTSQIIELLEVRRRLGFSENV